MTLPRHVRQVDLREQRYAVVDIETSGKVPTEHAIIEIAVVHLDPGAEPALVLDTLVDGQASFGAEDIHAIRRSELHGAPTFGEIGAELWNAFAGRIVVAHAASNCDVPFLAASYYRHGVVFEPPFLCTMLLDHLLTGKPGRPLDELAAEIGLGRSGCHVAAVDAALTAWVLRHQLEWLHRNHKCTPAALLALNTGSTSLRSLGTPPLGPVPAPAIGRRRSRSGLAGRLDPQRFRRGMTQTEASATYRQALIACLYDGIVDVGEFELLANLRKGLDEGEARSAHAFALVQVLWPVALSGFVSDAEAERIDHACRVLSSLGWAPSSQ